MQILMRLKQKKKEDEKNVDLQAGGSNSRADASQQLIVQDPPAEPKKSFFRDGGPADGCFYTFFVGIFIAMAVVGRSRGELNYSQTESLRNKFIDQDTFGCYNCEEPVAFGGIRTIPDIYYYIEDVLFPGLFNTVRFNGSVINDTRKQAYVTSQGRLLAGFRLRQVRMADVDCAVNDNDSFTQCWSVDEYSTDDYYGPHGTWADSPYEYIDSGTLEDQRWTGKHGTYSGGGYIHDFLVTDTPSERNATIQKMIDGDWIDGGTRAVFIDFTVFNPSSLLHSVIRLAVEMPAGSVYPYSEFKSWIFLRYANGSSLFALNMLFITIVIIRTIALIWNMSGAKIIRQPKFKITNECSKCLGCRKWISKGWNKLDCLNMLVFYFMIALFATNYGYSINIEMTNIYSYQSFRRLQYIFKTEANLQAVGGLLLLFKMFKFLGVNERFKFLFTMFAESSQGLIVFTIVLSVFFMSFGMAGFLLFCSDVHDFRSFTYAMANMVRYTVAELDYSQLSASSAMAGSAYYFAWSLLMLLVLANVFVAILSEAYVRVASRFDNDNSGLGFGKVMRKARNRVRKLLNLKLEEIDLDGDGLLSVDEIVQAYGISRKRAEKYVKKFDTDGDGQLNKDEFEKWMEMEKHREKGMSSSSTIASVDSDRPDNNNKNSNNITTSGNNNTTNTDVEIVRLRSTSNSRNNSYIDETGPDLGSADEEQIDEPLSNDNNNNNDADDDDDNKENENGRNQNETDFLSLPGTTNNGQHLSHETDFGELDDLVSELKNSHNHVSESVQM